MSFSGQKLERLGSISFPGKNIVEKSLQYLEAIEIIFKFSPKLKIKN